MSREDERNRALHHLVQVCARRGYGLAHDLTGQRADAQDAVQEALVRACAHYGRLRDPAALEGWFYRVLTHHCLRLLRRRRLRSALTRWLAPAAAAQQDPRPPPDEALAWRRQLTRLLEAVDALPSRQRVALVLRYRHDLALGEIANLLGVTVGTVKTHLARGLDRLREQMESTR
ncbi:MAG TPA: sigma-70 family RNA polymerase sigma factor [Polyangia bacterium]|nr:sigma-70 family RNA polymerase sigma factor [Polyangia bacterium]